MIGAIVLAGGNARRLGGASKGDVVVGGQTMLTSVTDACQAAGVARDNIVVVGHAETELKRTVEDPPRSGPAAGIGAGLDHVTGDRLFILSCDIPFIASGLPTLIDSYAGDGVCFGGEKPQYLAGLYSASAVRARAEKLIEEGGLAGLPVRALLGALDVTVLGPSPAARDLDTWDEVEQAQRER
ncbi:molybdenum cofactor guanylyltransferase [Flaviflexus salsibiostraticola]|nr:NTP transferase domain-containing protein [Flaviflexus salsibiostraticola]